MKRVLILLSIVLLAHSGWCQINNTGLPIGISGGTTVSTDFDFASAGDITNEGDLNLKSGVQLSGDYTGSGSFVLDGAEQTLDITATIPSVVLSGGDKTLSSDFTVGTLDLSLSASIICAGNSVLVTGEILGFDQDNNIVGKLIRSGSDSLYYPISNGNNYTPAVITGITGTDYAVGMQSFEPGVSGGAGYGLLSVSDDRHWVVSQDGGTFTSGLLTLSAINETLAESLSDLTVARRSGSNFSGLGLAVTEGTLLQGTVTSTTPSAAGTYTLGKYFDESLRVNDSTALVSIYNSLVGIDWISKSGWLKSNLNSWSGLTISEKRVTGINLPANNMVGAFPQMEEGLENLTIVNLSNNEIDELPLLTSLTNITSANFSQNRLDFASIVPNLPVSGFQYANQKKVGVEKDTLFEQSSEVTYTISRAVGGSDNAYSWFKRDKSGNVSPITNSGSTYGLNVESFADEGYYYAEVTNPSVSEFNLTTTDIFVKVSSLERDRVALMEFFEATNGAGWSNSTGWGGETVTSSWFGVSVNNNRVTGVSLPNNNMDGKVPESFADLVSLTAVNLENNSLRSFPDMSGVSGITSLDLSNNRLVFTDIVPNKDVPGIDYSNQKRFGTTLYDTLDAGTDYELRYAALGDANTNYQWYFGPLVPGQIFNNNVSAVSGATSRVYTIEDIDINSQGTYRLRVTHPDVEGLVLESRNQNIMAQTDFFGNLSQEGTPIEKGEVAVWRKTPQGPFRLESTVNVDTDGDYIIEDVVLGTFVVLARPDRTTYPDLLQTYYVKAPTYTEADALYLDGVTTGVNIEMISIAPDEPTQQGAQIYGFLEEQFELPEDEEARVTDRRKVRKAACSMRRFKSQGRPSQDISDDFEEEIAYYIETDDEGYFNFEGVADGKYLLNIEFPGVPMDENSEIVFELGGDKENQVIEVNALITESGITVDQEEILYNIKPYVKDLQFYPNPTEGLLALDYTVYRAVDDLQIQLTSMDGKVIKQATIPHYKGRWHTKMDLTDLSVGLYQLVFTNEAGSFRQSVKVGRK